MVRRLTKEVHVYTNPSEAAKAADQLVVAGKKIRVGQWVRFIYTHGGKSNVYAWDQPVQPDYAIVNKARYKELLLRAVHQIVLPLGLGEEDLASLVSENVRQLALWSESEFESAFVDYSEDEFTLADLLFSPYITPK